MLKRILEGVFWGPRISDEPQNRAETSLILTASIAIVACLIGAGAGVLNLADNIGPEHETAKKIISHFGTFLLVSSTSALIYRVFFRPLIQARQNARIMRLFEKELDRLEPKVFAFGLTKIEHRIDYATVFSSLQRDDELWWLDTYAPGYQHWRRSLDRAISSGAKIRMLVLKPNCEIATLRAKEIKDSVRPDDFLNGLNQFYDDMVARAASTGNQAMEVRIYGDLIGCPIYLIKREGRAIKAFSSLFLNEATFEVPHFVWEGAKERSFLEALEKYVDEKWKNARAPSKRLTEHQFEEDVDFNIH